MHEFDPATPLTIDERIQDVIERQRTVEIADGRRKAGIPETTSVPKSAKEIAAELLGPEPPVSKMDTVRELHTIPPEARALASLMVRHANQP